MTNLASTLTQEGHYPEAERLQRGTLDIQRRVLGPEHPEALRSMTKSAYAWLWVRNEATYSGW
jgi:tetratricopeptide repeat protein